MKKVELTGVNTSELPVLSNDEMTDLFKRLRKGDLQAKDELVNGNLRLVLSVLQKFRNRNHSIDDLFQVGCIGLVKSIDNFDIERGVRFSTYAVPMIIGEIKRYIRDNREIRVSRSIRNTAYRALKLRDKLRNQNAEEPTIDQIAKKLDIPAEDIVYALEATKNPISLFKPVYEDEGEPLRLMDQLSDDKGLDWIEEINVREAFHVLTSREKLIIRLRFYEGETQANIAERIGVSQAQISRIQKKALGKLQKAAEVREEAQ